MSSIIKELWVFSNAGIPIVEISKETGLNKYLMGSFISAIKTCSQQLSEKGLNSFIMENYKFILTSVLDSNAILVCMCESNIKDKKIHKQCEVIARIFEEIYKPEDVKNWDGDVSFFDEFREKLELYFKMGNL
ncbi:MAG: hypothetical protein EU532_09460 [Promethearchaeota archaeon]|nr:MAG: hypothetical protein EU532_09460 [Candidatus Lokiarchaeota archaeon]